MRRVITARGPHQEDNSALPHSEALQSEFTVALARVFHRDHWVIEDRFQGCKIDLVLPEVLPALLLVPSDHEQNVDAFCVRVKQIVDTEKWAG